jgi:hypothetical protein
MCELALPANVFIERKVCKITEYGFSDNTFQTQNVSFGNADGRHRTLGFDIQKAAR